MFKYLLLCNTLMICVKTSFSNNWEFSLTIIYYSVYYTTAIYSNVTHDYYVITDSVFLKM